MASGDSAARSRAELRRELGVGSAALLVVGGIIGSGIFFTPAEVAAALPSAGWILAVWVAGGLVALAGALTYAELGAMMPDAGGAYIYIREAFGARPAFLYGVMLLGIIATGALAAVAMGFAGYVDSFVGLGALGERLDPRRVLGEHPGRVVVAAITIALLTATNYLGIKPGAFVQNVLTVAKVTALGALILAGLFLWGRVGAPAAVAGAPAAPPLPAGIAGAFVAVLFTIGGWQQMNMVAGEIRDPSRTIPRGLLIGIGVVIAIYLGANAVYLHALGRDGLAASGAVAGDTAMRLVGPTGATLIRAGAMLSILGFVNVVILATPRIVFVMARDGVFPRAASAVHPRFGSPHVAIVVIGAWSLILLVATRGDVGALLGGVVFADWIFFGLGGASVLVLRRTRPDVARPYRVPGYPLVPVFFLTAAMIGIVSAIVRSPMTSLLGGALLTAGAIAHALISRRQATIS
jgi:APA family basic amino acid/polyamine antiporter